eukprot:GHVR01043451.1.p1 GENE.GHVR01043451.1~~GHVR01043451.1.p1  ORF type:complete len:321 (+),score=88.10 GHVR01043451.1:127-1089(+)
MMGRVITLGDIHSDGINAKLILTAAGLVDSNGHWTGGNTMLIQLGDIVDRGPDTKLLYKWFRQLRKEAALSGGKVIQLLGNHEPMQILGLLQYVTPEDFNNYGGAAKRAAAFSKDGLDGKYIRNLDTVVMVNGIVFVHAGLTPELGKKGIKYVNEEVRKSLNEYEEGSRPSYDSLLFAEDGPLWNRHYSTGDEISACSDLNKTLKYLNGTKMIVGHTIQEGGNVNTRCNGNFILSDTGGSRYIQNTPTLVEFFNDGSVVQHSLNRKDGHNPSIVSKEIIKPNINININNIIDDGTVIDQSSDSDDDGQCTLQNGAACVSR